MGQELDYMKNAEGHLVPIDKVKPADALEDGLVKRLCREARELSCLIRKFKAICFEEVDTLMEVLSEEYGLSKGGAKGNLSLTSYDGLLRVQISVADFLNFGPELQVAKQLIDECILEWGEGSNENIQAIVNHAFRVDKNNRINVQAILGLRRLEIDDPKWKRAMDAISDSIQVARSKRYVRFYVRPEPEADWEAIKLDIARV